MNAILYKIDNGCKGRNLPHDLPPWQTVCSFFRRPKTSGLWDEILQFLVELTRQIENRAPAPSYAIIDSESVKTVAGSEERGIDGGKIKGRMRHIVVDTMGNLFRLLSMLPIFTTQKRKFW